MNITGIITEYNPFHNGHKFHLEEAKKQTNCDGVICIMSGNFVQRGGPAIVDKWQRTEMALNNGVDLIMELPSFKIAFIYSIPKMLFDEVTILFISSSFKYSIKLFSRDFAKVRPNDKFLFNKFWKSESSLTRTLAISNSFLLSPHSEPKKILSTTPKEFNIETAPFAKNSAEETA